MKTLDCNFRFRKKSQCIDLPVRILNLYGKNFLVDTEYGGLFLRNCPEAQEYIHTRLYRDRRFYNLNSTGKTITIDLNAMHSTSSLCLPPKGILLVKLYPLICSWTKLQCRYSSSPLDLLFRTDRLVPRPSSPSCL